MAVPVLILGAAGIAALTGLGSGASALCKNEKAKDISMVAQATYDHAKGKAERAREKSSKCLEELGQLKLTVLDQSINRFIAAFEKIHNIELSDSTGLNELKKFRLDKQSTLEMRELGTMATSIIGGLVGGVGAGALAAFGAYGATMTFAAASTGTAIATLSGAAATNATLAFLGGGALAAGGGGMALGSAVLGGAVAGPAIAILGIVMNASASKNLDNAYTNKWNAEELAEGLNVVTTLCNGISGRAMMFTSLLGKLDLILANLTVELERINNTTGSDYRNYSGYEQNVVAMALSVAGAIKRVLDTPILNKDGSLSDTSASTREEIKGFLKSIDSNSCNDLPDENVESTNKGDYADLLKKKIIEIFGDRDWREYQDERFCQNVINGVCRGKVKLENILYFCDMTVRSNGTKGLALTDSGIFCNYDDNLCVNYSDITQVKLHEKESFIDANVLYIFTPDGKMHRHTWVNPFKLKKFLDYAISLYQ